MKNIGAKLLLLVTIAVAVLVMAPGRARKDASASSTSLPAAREQKTQGRDLESRKSGRGAEEKHGEGSAASATSMEDRQFYIAGISMAP